MKKYQHLSVAVLVSALAIPGFAYAQEGLDHPGTVPPPPSPAIQGNITARLRSDYQAGFQNLQNNRDYRNGLMRGGHASSSTEIVNGTSSLPVDMDRFGSSTSARMYPASTTLSSLRHLPARLVPPLFKRFASSTALASSTIIERGLDDRQHGSAVRADEFAAMQDNLVQQADQALVNLQNIRGRISTKIQTETAQDIDMDQAESLLAIAETDLVSAQRAIQALAAYVPHATSTIIASTTIDLSQAQRLGDTAIESLDTSQQALDKTVDSISAATDSQATGTSKEQIPQATGSSNQ